MLPALSRSVVFALLCQAGQPDDLPPLPDPSTLPTALTATDLAATPAAVDAALSDMGMPPIAALTSIPFVSGATAAECRALLARWACGDALADAVALPDSQTLRRDRAPARFDALRGRRAGCRELWRGWGCGCGCRHCHGRPR